MKLNRGEWAELYAKTYLILSGALVELDEQLEPLPGKFHKIIALCPDPSHYEDEISLKALQDRVLSPLSRFELERLNQMFFEEIKNGQGPSFESKNGPLVASQLGINTYKSGSNNKADVGLKLESLAYSQGEILGFSIKSKISNPPTLLNASKHNTNFQFEITGELKDWTQYHGSQGTLRSLLQRLVSEGAKFSFSGVRAGKLEDSMNIFSSTFSSEVAGFLLSHYLGQGSTLKRALEIAASAREPQWKLGAQYRLGKFLEAIALGLTPTKLWNPEHAEWGGYIIVMTDGTVGGLRAFNSSALTNYLLENTKFDTPSRGKHEYGFVYQREGRFYIDLALQLRESSG